MVNMIVTLKPLTIVGKNGQPVEVYVGPYPIVYIYIQASQVELLNFGEFEVSVTQDNQIVQLIDGRFVYPTPRVQYINGANVLIYPVIGYWKLHTV